MPMLRLPCWVAFLEHAHKPWQWVKQPHKMCPSPGKAAGQVTLFIIIPLCKAGEFIKHAPEVTQGVLWKASPLTICITRNEVEDL